MSNSSFILVEQEIIDTYDLLIPLSVRFWIYLIPNILSIFCSIFVLFHLLYDKTLRQALNNHIIIILLFVGLIYELTSVPMMLCYFHFGKTWVITHTVSHIWTFTDYLCYTTQLVGFAWATIERHILIFHHQWVSTRKKRFILHYFPLTLLLIYCFTYYFVFILFPFCEDLFIPSPFNGVPMSCILFDPITLTYDTINHQIIPTFVIIIFSVALLIRVILLKTRLHQTLQWRKQRKMTIQLLSISILYFLFMGPRTIFQFCLIFGILTYEVIMSYLHSGFFANYIIFLFPFVCCGSMPELAKKLKKLSFCRKQRQVIVPEHLPINRLVNR